MSWFNMSEQQYGEYVKQKSPNSKLWPDVFKAFITGGAICCIGQAFLELYLFLGLTSEMAAPLMSVTLIFLGVLLTGLEVYDDLAKFGGAGTLVPITGFANAVASPALEFKTEGLITGLAAKMFIISGPVIVYGTSASVIYGIILYIVRLII